MLWVERPRIIAGCRRRVAAEFLYSFKQFSVLAFAFFFPILVDDVVLPQDFLLL